MLLGGIEFEITRKCVKHLRLSIHPSADKVQVTAPRFVSTAEIQRMLVSKLPWINAKQAQFRSRTRVAEPTFHTGEIHYVQGEAYCLQVVEIAGRPRVLQQEPGTLTMQIPANATPLERQALLQAWYRNELKKRVSPLIAKWEVIMQVTVSDWRIKKMKTRWGTCNAHARRIWLNLDLAQQSDACLEYVVVHELVHFFERLHNARFKAYMDAFLPDWRVRKAKLNAPNLGH